MWFKLFKRRTRRRRRSGKRGGKLESTLSLVVDAAQSAVESYENLDDFTFESIVYKDRWSKETSRSNVSKKEMNAAAKDIPDFSFVDANRLLDGLIVQNNNNKNKVTINVPTVNDLMRFNSLSSERMMVLLYKCDTRNYFFNLNTFINDPALIENARKNELELRRQYIVKNMALNKVALFATPTAKSDFMGKLGKYAMDKTMAPTAPVAPVKTTTTVAPVAPVAATAAVKTTTVAPVVPVKTTTTVATVAPVTTVGMRRKKTQKFRRV